MRTDISLKDRLEDIVGDVDTLSQWDNDYFDLAINRACKDIVRRIKLINPEKLSDFIKTFVTYNKEMPYSLQIGSGENPSSTTGHDSGLYSLGHYIVAPGYTETDTVLEADSNCTAKLAGNPYIVVLIVGKQSQTEVEIMRVKALSFGGDDEKFSVYRGLFGTKISPLVILPGGTDAVIYRVEEVSEILEVVNVSRRNHWESKAAAPWQNPEEVYYDDYEAKEAPPNVANVLERTITNINSMFRASTTFPLYVKKNGRIKVYPEVNGVLYASGTELSRYDNRIVMDAIVAPLRGSESLSHFQIDGLPTEYQDLAMLFVAIDILRVKIRDLEQGITSIDEVVAPADVTISTPSGSIASYSFTDTFNMPTIDNISSLDVYSGATPPSYIPAVLDVIADPSITDLTITASLPSAPSDLTLNSVLPSSSLPTFEDVAVNETTTLSLDAAPTYTTLTLPSAPVVTISIADIPDYVTAAEVDLPNSIVITAAPTIPTPPAHSDLVLPDAPTLTETVLTLPNIALFPATDDLPVFTIETPPLLSTMESLPAPPTPITIADGAYATIGVEPSSPSSVNFPAAPAVPTMGSLPEAPEIITDYGTVDHTVAPVNLSLPNISDPSIGSPPSFADYAIDTDFTATWQALAPSGMVSEWGHDLLDESGGSISTKLWSFEHALQVEEDPEVAELRLKQMAVEVDKWKSKNDVLARAYEAEMSGYTEGIRAEIAKIQGEAEIAGAMARAAVASVEADKAVIDGQVASIQGKAAGMKASSEAYLANVNGIIASFEGQASALTKIYVGQVQGISQQFATEADFNVAQFREAYQSQVQLMKLNLDKDMNLYATNIQQYGTEVQMAIAKWGTTEWRAKIEKWKIEMEIKTAKYQAEIGAVIQNNAAKVARANTMNQTTLANYGNEVQRNNTRYASELQAYGTLVGATLQKYQSERDLKLAQFRDEHTLHVQAYNVRFQTAISEYTARAGAYVQKKSSEIAINTGKAQADVAQFGSRLQKESSEYNLRLQAYGVEAQAETAKIHKIKDLEFQTWVNTQNQKITKHQAEVQENLQLLQQRIAQGIQKFTLNLNKYQAELGTNVADKVQKPTSEFQMNLQKYSGLLQEYGASINKQIQEYQTNLQSELGVWNTNKQSGLQEYQGKIASANAQIQSDMQIYINRVQTNLGVFNAEENAETQRFHAEIRGEASRYQMILQESVQEFQAGVQKYTADAGAVFQTNQARLARYQADIQKFQMEVGKNLQYSQMDLQQIQAKIGIHNSQIQMLSEQYERGFVPYQANNQEQQQGGQNA